MMPLQTILLIDDNEVLLECIGESLRLNGHRVLEANSGQQGMDHFVSYQSEIGLVVSDTQVMGESGGLTAREIRALNREIPVVFMTFDDCVETFRSIGEFDHYYVLKKPFSMEYIDACVSGILSE